MLFAKLKRMEKIMEAKKRIFDSDDFEKKNFESDNGKCPALNKARAYVKNWQTMKENNCGLIFLGDVGTGKTFAAACIANALVSVGVSVRMTSFNNALKAVFAAENKEKIFDELCGYDLLILDDLGAERDTSYAVEQLYNLIDKRYISGKPMIITTNIPLKELKNPSNTAYKRIYDRILEMCVAVAFRNENMRRAVAAEKRALAVSVLTEPDEVQTESCESTCEGEEKTEIVEDKIFHTRMSPKGKYGVDISEAQEDKYKNSS